MKIYKKPETITIVVEAQTLIGISTVDPDSGVLPGTEDAKKFDFFDEDDMHAENAELSVWEVEEATRRRAQKSLW